MFSKVFVYLCSASGGMQADIWLSPRAKRYESNIKRGAEIGPGWFAADRTDSKHLDLCILFSVNTVPGLREKSTHFWYKITQ